jgi:DNA-3-methyladenine glycosylase
MHSLPRSFYERPTIDVARDLLGMVLVHGTKRGHIVEVEAYLPHEDPAAHSFRGLTNRTKVLFGPGGHAYVYLSYGMHECLNVSCEPEGTPGCVLIRGLDFVSGPGRVTKAMGVTRAHYGADLTDGPLRIVRGSPPRKIQTTPRIGITKAADRLLRFVAND